MQVAERELPAAAAVDVRGFTCHYRVSGTRATGRPPVFMGGAFQAFFEDCSLAPVTASEQEPRAVPWAA